MKKLMTLVLSALSILFFNMNRLDAGFIDPAHPQDIVVIDPIMAPDIYAWKSAAEEIRDLNITKDVVDLYRTYQVDTSSEGLVGMVENKDYALYFRIQNGRPSFIKHVIVKIHQ